jgi:3-isopropylmalate/(R)-2-methylmalate dehydratase small subunit
MTMQFTTLTSRLAPMRINNVDTDQIIPARFLTGTTRTGLGESLFADLRRSQDGTIRSEFVLNRPEYQGAQILIAGENFGCGSSREHAAWALKDYGFRAVISSSFGDIFHANALKNGIVPVRLPAQTTETLFDLADRHPDALVQVNLEEMEIRWPGGMSTFPMEAFARRCLLDGIDQLGYIQKFAGAIEEYEISHAKAQK